MPIENATYISELNPDWPVGSSDFVSQGDDHFRMMKKTLQNTLPNANGPITGTPAQLNNLTGGISFYEANEEGDPLDAHYVFNDPNDTSKRVTLQFAPPSEGDLLGSNGGQMGVTWETMRSYIWPVGAPFISFTDNRNPIEILGFGTWESVVGLIAGVGSATDCQGYTQNYSTGYQPGFWRVQNFHIVHTEYDVSLTMDPVDPHTHGEATINSFYNDSGHTATVPGDGTGATGSAGGHTPTGTGHLTIGEGAPTDSTAFFNPYYGAYIWRRTA